MFVLRDAAPQGASAPRGSHRGPRRRRSPGRSRPRPAASAPSAAKAGSRSASRSRKLPSADARAAHLADRRPLRLSTAAPEGAATTLWADCQRLNASVSCRSSTSSSSFDRSSATLTGAEKSRNTDGAGGCDTFVKVRLSLSRSSRKTPCGSTRSLFAASAAPSARHEAEAGPGSPSGACRSRPAWRWWPA